MGISQEFQGGNAKKTSFEKANEDSTHPTSRRVGRRNGIPSNSAMESRLD
jgi:hypothetical protein